MSGAICGYINLNEKKAITNLGLKMIEEFSFYKLDSIRHITSDNVFMGCGLLNIDKQFNTEVLPYIDKENGLIITADVAIYNRKELLSELNIKDDFNDSQLVLKAFIKWNEECIDHIVGDFSFVIWDINKKEMFGARDHVGSRTLYYKYNKDQISFSTLLKPILAITDEININEEWLVDYLALPGVIHEYEGKDTIYRDIHQLPPGSLFKVKNGILNIKKYWNPLENVSELKFNSDEEYDKAFRKVLYEAVESRIVSEKNIGIMMSGGLDSGTIACIAADKLSKENKALKAYSSIPMKGYIGKELSRYFIPNESEYIEEIVNKYKNIELKYCRCEGKNATYDIDRFIKVFEQPYKVFKNLVWLDDIEKKAINDGCKVILTGQYGNSTISFGNYETHVRTLATKGKLISILKEVNGVSKIQKVPRSYALKKTVKIALPYKLRCYLERNKGIDINKNFKYINNDLIKKWNEEKKLYKSGFNNKIQKYYTLNEIHEFIVREGAFSHIGAIETKLSLYNGVIIRDPSRDKRVIEFCLSLPSEQYVNNGEERHIIRRAMRGIVPDKILDNRRRRGLQSADWIERINNEWSSIFDIINNALENKQLNYYINIDELKKDLLQCKDGINSEKSDIVQRLLIVTIVSRYLDTLNLEFLIDKKEIAMI